ncbi:hypothetical protein ACFL26_01095 [Patescibacteria group bacterium]
MPETKKTSLGQYIADTHQLLTTLAVFAALAGFASNLPIKWLAGALVFTLVVGMILIWHEIQSRLPKKLSVRETKLFLFRYVLLFGFWGFILYLLLEFRAVWRVFLFIPLTAVFAYVLHFSLRPLFDTLEALKKRFLPGEPQWYKTLFSTIRVIYVVSVILFSFGLATELHPAANLLLDVIKTKFQ